VKVEVTERLGGSWGIGRGMESMGKEAVGGGDETRGRGGVRSGEAYE